MENVRRLFVVGKKLFIAGCVLKTFTLYGFDVWLLTEKSMEPTLTDGKKAFPPLLSMTIFIFQKISKHI